MGEQKHKVAAVLRKNIEAFMPKQVDIDRPVEVNVVIKEGAQPV